jgi:hypothetical protein
MCLANVLLGAWPLAAQFATTQFTANVNYGKNRIQYKTFEWQYLTSPNFEVFYYGDGEALARLTAQMAEQSFGNITDLAGFAPYSRVKIFVYPSVAELHQSNIGVGKQSFSVAGQTSFAKQEIEIAFAGSREVYQQQLTLSIAENLIFEMMYGGNLKDMLQSTYLLNLPDWFMAGAARYVAFGWSGEMDDYLRDVLQNKKMRRISNLEGQEAHLVGQSIWNFIVEKYGRTNVANILNLTRIVRNEESSIQNTLGVGFQRFINMWMSFYLDQNKELAAAHKMPDAARRLAPNLREHVYTGVKFNPQGSLLAYTENNRGRTHLKVRDLATGKERTVFSSGFRLINQKNDFVLPLFAWKGNQTLAIVHVQEGKQWLTTLEVGGRGRSRRPLDQVEQVLAIDVADHGGQMVMSAANRGQSDIYVYDFEADKLSRITNDLHDDLDPAFLKKTKGLSFVFSSNRENDTLDVKKRDANELDDRFNLFVYDAARSKTVLKRITNTLSHDFAPKALDANSLVYASDQRGITHLYRYDLKDEVSSQITNYLYSFRNYDVAGSRLAMSMSYQGRPGLFLYDDFDAKAALFTAKTNRQQLLDLRRLSAMRARNEREQQPVFDPQGKKDLDTAQAAPADTAQKKTDEADTENYRFDIFNQPKKKPNRLLPNYRPTQAGGKPGETKLSNPQAYNSKFSADNLVTSIVIDPLRGWGILLEANLNDALENHRFGAGLFGLTTLRSGMYYAQYEYLKGRLDYKVRFDRQNLQQPTSEFTQRYAMNRITGTVSYPINVTSRVSLSPFWANTTFDVTSDRNSSIQQIRGSNFQYAGAGAEFVFDNSIITGPNMLDGSRLLVRYDQWLGVNAANKSFGNLTVDARTYQKLGRLFIFAGRFAYGQFFGPAGKTYRLGGVGNWIFNDTDPLPNRDPLAINPNDPQSAAVDRSDLLFVQYVGNLRGFNWNKLRGNTYILMNAEVRMPLLKYFYKSAITSNFLRNMMLVGFADVGASWTGISPFNSQNALNTVSDARTPFSWTASDFRNPFLVGLGGGLRTSLLGYYTKFDVAWGIENGQVLDPIFYVSLGYDF